MELSDNFSREEFKCKCGNCNFDTVDYELVVVLEAMRNHFEQPITINSACRCARHNASVGGAPGSKHLYGIAADVVVKNILPEDVYAYLIRAYPDKYGIGCYNSFTHIDVRNSKARW